MNAALGVVLMVSTNTRKVVRLVLILVVNFIFRTMEWMVISYISLDRDSNGSLVGCIRGLGTNGFSSDSELILVKDKPGHMINKDGLVRELTLKMF